MKFVDPLTDFKIEICKGVAGYCVVRLGSKYDYLDPSLNWWSEPYYFQYEESAKDAYCRYIRNITGVIPKQKLSSKRLEEISSILK